MSEQKPYLLNITLYSLLVVLSLLLIANSYLVYNIDKIETLYAFFHIDSYQIRSTGAVYISLSLILIAIYSVIQMLRRKIHGIYLFFFISLIVTVYLIQNEPFELVNIFILIIINYVLFMYRSWFKYIKNPETHTSEDKIE